MKGILHCVQLRIGGFSWVNAFQEIGLTLKACFSDDI
jgi:hypothetical protein